MLNLWISKGSFTGDIPNLVEGIRDVTKALCSGMKETCLE